MLYLTFLAFTLGVVYYIWLTLEKRKKRAWEKAETKKILYDFLKSRIIENKAANLEVATYLKNNNGYFSNYQLTSWEKQYTALFAEIDQNEFEHIGLGDDEIAIITQFFQFTCVIPLH